MWQQKYIFLHYVSANVATFLFFLYFCTRFFKITKELIEINRR